jgi:hypothetical protein
MQIKVKFDAHCFLYAKHRNLNNKVSLWQGNKINDMLSSIVIYISNLTIIVQNKLGECKLVNA